MLSGTLSIPCSLGSYSKYKSKTDLASEESFKKKTGKNNVFGLKNQIDNRLEKSIIFVKPKLIT